MASILQLLKLPDGTVKVLVEGGRRARIKRYTQEADFFVAKAEYLESEPLEDKEEEVLVRSAIGQFEGYIA